MLRRICCENIVNITFLYKKGPCLKGGAGRMFFWEDERDRRLTKKRREEGKGCGKLY